MGRTDAGRNRGRKAGVARRARGLTLVALGLAALALAGAPRIGGAMPLAPVNPAAVPGLTVDPGAPVPLAAAHATPRVRKAPTPTDPAALAGQLRKAFAARGPVLPARNGLAALSEGQRSTLKALSERTDAPVVARFRKANGTLGFLKLQGGVRPLGAAGGPEAAATRFLADNRALLRLDDPARELSLVRRETDALGQTHLRYRQMFHGVPVWGRDVSVHVSDSDAVYLFMGYQEATPKGVNTAPTIGAADAVAVAEAHLGVPAGADPKASSELMLYPGRGGVMRLVYRVAIQPALDQRWIYFVDAADGRVVHRISNIHHAGSLVSASGTDLGGQSRSFTAWSEGGSFYLLDPSTPYPDASYDPRNELNPVGDTAILDAREGQGDTLYEVTSSQAGAGWDPTAVSAAYNTRAVYDYYLNTFGRDSIDDAGKNLLTVVHFDRNYNNAFWQGTFMVYGDGDGQIFAPLAGALDVAAHEMTHGVTESTAGLIYENQSGALNESFSDVFGVMLDPNDWLIGEDVTVASPGYLRNMADPAQGLSPQPTRMSEYQNLPNTDQGDWGGVHVNSGIPNRAAYLIAEGLTAESLGTSIGRDETARIYYRALTTYLEASAQFIDARRALIQSAEDLYGAGSTEAVAVARAWDEVEVTEGDVPSPTDPSRTPTDPVSGEDVMVYLYPADGVADTPASEDFHVYAQYMGNPFTGYPNSRDVYLENPVSAFFTRPAALTDAFGTTFFYVGSDYNLYAVDEADTTTHTALTSSGDIWSIAVSPDGRYLAYTTINADDDHIYVVDLETGGTAVYSIIPPDYQQGGTRTASTVFYADALAFDYTGRNIVFDALHCVSLPGDACSLSGGGYQYWSVALMTVSDGSVSFLFPTQNPSIDVGNPVFASNNDFVIAMDTLDFTDPSGTVVSQVVTVDLERQAFGLVAELGRGADGMWGVPGFWGDDDFVTVQVPDTTYGKAAYRVPIGADWQGNAAAMERLNDYAVAMPIMHRTGQRVLSGGLSAGTALLDFGDVALGEAARLTLTLHNAANRDLRVTGIDLAGAEFAQNATNGPVPRGQDVTVAVTFRPTGDAGTRTGTLTFHSDGDPADLAISLAGNATGGDTTGDTTGDTPGDTPGDGGGSGADGGNGDAGGGDQTSAGGGSKGGCFFAGALYPGDAPEVASLRRFRDRVLGRFGWGRTVIDWYYEHAPGWATWISRRPATAATLRAALAPLVATADVLAGGPD